MHTLTMEPRRSLGAGAFTARQILRLPDGKGYSLTRWRGRTFINALPTVIALHALEPDPEIHVTWGDLVDVDGDQYRVDPPARPARHHAEIVPVPAAGEILFRVNPDTVGATYVVAAPDVVAAMRIAWPEFDYAEPASWDEGRYVVRARGKALGTLKVETPAAVTA